MPQLNRLSLSVNSSLVSGKNVALRPLDYSWFTGERDRRLDLDVERYRFLDAHFPAEPGSGLSYTSNQSAPV
jgi:hypothetical protein